MKKQIVFIILSGLLFTGSAYTQINVLKVGHDLIEPATDGFFYSLPRTGVRVDIEVKKTQKIKGPYSEFADKYLGLSQVVNLNSTEFEISAIQLSIVNSPDPEEYYFVKSTGSKKDRQSLEIFLSENGALIGVEGNGRKISNDSDLKTMSSSRLSVAEISNPTMFERVDTVIRRISVDTTTIEQKVFKKISSAKTPEQKAKEAADFILKLDESMFNLINGYQEVSYEKGTMEYMYSQMDKLKNDYLQLFKGVTGVSRERFSFTYFPTKENEPMAVTLCRFSLSKGIIEKSLNSGDQIQLEIQSLDRLKGIRNFIAQRNSNVSKEKGIYYRIPEDALISIKIGGQVRLESQFPINQMGVVTFLPSTSTNNLELYNNTGGLKHVKAW
jgi:hypothetical protein